MGFSNNEGEGEAVPHLEPEIEPQYPVSLPMPAETAVASVSGTVEAEEALVEEHRPEHRRSRV